MPSKVIWLASLVTLAYWLGSIAGCSTTGDNQNLKILEDDPSMFDTSPDPDRPGAAMAPEPVVEDVQTAEAATTDDLPVPADAVQPTQPEEGLAAAPDEAAPAPEPVEETVAQPVVETEPSIASLDRSHWPRLAVSADSGRIDARPHYFEDLPLEQMRQDQADSQPLDSGDAVGWDKANFRAVFAQPVKFTMDLVMLPVRLVTDPPQGLQARSPFDELGRLPGLSEPTPDAQSVAE